MNGLFLADEGPEKFAILEAMFKLPPEERTAFLFKMAKEKKVEFLGLTEKSVPELATEMIKQGVVPKTYVMGQPKEAPKND